MPVAQDPQRHPLYHRVGSDRFLPELGAPIKVQRRMHDEPVGLHDHDFVELAVIESGTAQHRTVAGATALRPGDVIVLLPGQWHGYERLEQLWLWNVCFGVGLLGRELAWVRSDPLIGTLFPGAGEGAAVARQGGVILHGGAALLGALRPHLQALEALGDSPTPVRVRPEAIAQLLLVLARVAQIDGQEERVVGGTDPLIERVMQALEADLTAVWTLDHLAEICQLSRSYLVRRFRRHLGLAPMAWLAQRRAEQAAVLLLTTEESVAQIGSAVGWDDPGHFARRFRAVYGMSASAYRERFPLPRLRRKHMSGQSLGSE
jgi:AraC family L-rhamnose operon transcriptional activator RhaR